MSTLPSRWRSIPDGTVLWAKGYGAGDQGITRGAAIGSDGSSHVCGSMLATLDVDGTMLVGASDSSGASAQADVFAINFDPDGTVTSAVVWPEKVSQNCIDAARSAS